MKARTENFIYVVIGFVLFASQYVSATMNALHNSYFMGVEEFQTPFSLFNVIFLVFLLVLFFIGLFFRFKYKSSFAVGIKVSKLAFIACGLVFLLNFSPCFYSPPSQNSLLAVISQSFLCPHYSNRSYIGLIITVSFSLLVFISSRGGKNANP